ncbi:hypothetical protein [Conexibacter woesei]|uniref:hypothetical protein n=1 Tax=Conexibacter woesei TaxID=191495 RepID=UPI0003FBB943|nr:hypothetical protein [Conexibacter woesei]
MGDPEVVAIEAELEEPIDPGRWFGHFRLVVQGEGIGDWDDLAMVRGIVAWWESFVAEPVERWEHRLDGLSPEEAFDVVYDDVFGDDADVTLGAFGRYHINRLGMSAFDEVTLILFEPPGDEQWLLWRVQRGDPETWVVRHAVLPRGALQKVGAEFVAAVSDAVRSTGIPTDGTEPRSE